MIYELQAWLDIATKGLCPEAKERVSAEIRDHFEAALEARRAEGHSIIEAQAMVSDSLGSPKLARRQLRKTNLTTEDAIILAVAQSLPTPSLPGPKVVSILAGVLTLVLTVSLYAGDSRHIDFSSYWLLAMNLFCLICPYWIGPLIYRSLRANPLVKAIYCIFGVQTTACLASLSFMLVMRGIRPESDQFDLIFPLEIMAPSFYYTFTTWRLLQKLGSARDPVKS